MPPGGVYAVEAIVDGTVFPAVANLGSRPTFQGSEPGGGQAVLEVHLLDFERDLYGHELEVTFRQWLRPEQRFADVEALRAQIARDVAAARAALRA
jgi:riboflavin kinase/FMN adenylyltransferase